MQQKKAHRIDNVFREIRITFAFASHYFLNFPIEHVLNAYCIRLFSNHSVSEILEIKKKK